MLTSFFQFEMYLVIFRCIFTTVVSWMLYLILKCLLLGTLAPVLNYRFLKSCRASGGVCNWLKTLIIRCHSQETMLPNVDIFGVRPSHLLVKGYYSDAWSLIFRSCTIEPTLSWLASEIIGGIAVPFLIEDFSTLTTYVYGTM